MTFKEKCKIQEEFWEINSKRYLKRMIILDASLDAFEAIFYFLLIFLFNTGGKDGL